MAIRCLFDLDNENKDCGATRFKANGVCGGASLTWLAQAMQGNYLFNPHLPEPNLTRSKELKL